AVFEPDALRDAPQMWVLLARAETAEARTAAQRDVVAQHPNVSVIDLTLVQAALDEVIGRVSLVIRFLAAFSVATGFVVLLGSVATGRLERIRESVLLKTLGATRRQIGAILASEYALLGLLAVIVGALLALAASWALARFLFDVAFEPALLPMLGLAAGREVFRTTPMEALREEGAESPLPPRRLAGRLVFWIDLQAGAAGGRGASIRLCGAPSPAEPPA